MSQMKNIQIQIAKWLPASEIKGEGIFIQLDEEAVQAWESRSDVLTRGKELLAGYDHRLGVAPALALDALIFSQRR